MTLIDGSNHHTSITIDWNGMTIDELTTIAQRAIINSLQHEWKVYKNCPDSINVIAKHHLDIHTPKPVKPLGRIQGNSKTNNLNNDLDISMLTDIEKKELINILQG